MPILPATRRARVSLDMAKGRGKRTPRPERLRMVEHHDPQVDMDVDAGQRYRRRWRRRQAQHLPDLGADAGGEAPLQDPAIADQEPGAIVIPGIDGNVGPLRDLATEFLGEARG